MIEQLSRGLELTPPQRCGLLAGDVQDLLIQAHAHSPYADDEEEELLGATPRLLNMLALCAFSRARADSMAVN